MSQNKSIAESNQNIIPNSDNSLSKNMSIKQKDQSIVDNSLNSKNSNNGYEFNGNAGIQAAQQGTRNKR
ncbi:hypothetical protein [Clostridium estertheticum]|uniref:Uncharacterized protein n=2 Tax=Clostridium estertheticum TaxID=238834 RepID=A0A1J0GDB2_9CLOT|nr:hypothetical protein [Clostridium estertheticum]APC39345.1 hypothetical protein A7L45_04360 [Clostridium estertheticum subsp. estertheticum]MBU3072019.1 hypothetical protein [Clostridium estertheticum]MBU3162111.1 hypothetical protein [Clostridium estertheticum]MBU3171060.1 hypothetical protein [Clostridium estertheticum]MBU3184827.1 hypothetical protein [Clostridium estertheticum]